MYSYKQMGGRGYVIHDESGCSLPYHSKAVKYTNQLIVHHHWKLDYFKIWFNYSSSQRRKIKEVKPTEAIQFLSLAHCKNAEPVAPPVCKNLWSISDEISFGCCKQEGTNPMYNKIEKTEVDVSRQYLIGRLNEANYVKRDQLRKLFNLDAIAIPKSYKELIAAIKDGKYAIDAKVAKRIDVCIDDEGQYYGSPLDGIIFTDFPEPDYEGHAPAVIAQTKEYTKVKDAIYGPSYEVAQKALTDFEAWVPTTA